MTTNPHETYNQLIDANDRLHQRLEACALSQSADFDLFFKSKEPFSREGIEEISKPSTPSAFGCNPSCWPSLWSKRQSIAS